MSDNVRCRVRRVVQDVKNILASTDSGTTRKSALLRLIPLLPSQDSLLIKSGVTSDDIPQHEMAEARTVFVSHEYSRLAEYLLGTISVETTAELNKNKGSWILEAFFTKGPAIESFLTLSHSLNKLSGYQVVKAVEILEKFLSEHGLYHCLKEVCFTQRSSSDHHDNRLWQEAVTHISSIPDRVLAKQKQETSAFFYPDQYIPIVCENMWMMIKDLYKTVKLGKDCAITPVCQLIGKLCLLAYGDEVWAPFTRLLLQEIIKDPGWCRMSESLVMRVPDRCMENTVVSLLLNIPWYGHVRKFLGNGPLTNRPLRFLLCNKLLLLRHYPDNHLLWNVIGYLAHDVATKHLFFEAVKRLLDVWGSSSSVKHASYEQHYYITRAILISLAFLKLHQSWQCEVRQDLHQKLLSGMPCHLDSSVVKIRRLGMLVGEHLTAVLDTTGHKLTFEYEKDCDTEALESLLTPPNDPGLDAVTSSLTNVSLGDTKCEKSEEMSKLTSEQTNDSELDSDDEFEPYDMSADTKVSKVKKPVYLRDCMEGLISSDDPDRVEICLINAEKIIRKNNDLLPEVAEEFTKVLLHQDTSLPIDGCSALRHSALVALAASAPQQVVTYLTKEVYARNYNLRQRMDILEVLATAAKELSRPPDRNLISEPVRTHVADESSENWRVVVQSRIESKTRRFCQGPQHQELPQQENRFGRVAGIFFFPLLANFDKTDVSVDLLGEDHIVLTRLLYTLGVIMFSAIHTNVVRQMAKALLEFLWLFRYHQQCGVRQAVHYSVCMTLLTVPHHMLVTDFHDDIYDIKTWLQDSVEKDADTECRQFAAQGLLLMENSLKKEFSNDGAG